MLKKIYKRDASFRAVFKVKTVALLFSPYPREMKYIPQNLNLPPFWRLLVSMEMVQSIPTRALSRARGLSMRTHLTAVEFLVLTKRSAASGDKNAYACPSDACVLKTRRRFVTERRKKRPKPHCLGKNVYAKGQNVAIITKLYTEYRKLSLTAKMIPLLEMIPKMSPKLP